ncbi:hypothetical protein [Bradyrhizobium ottawaense]|uniref:hypothetical protein n=1 Tax=Bradyrhizobium ottawaense TaxID=931866 RepID=UPI0030F42C7F
MVTSFAGSEDLDVPCDGFEQLRVLDRDRRRRLALERLADRMSLVIPGRDLVAMEGNDLGKGIVQLFGRQFGGQRLGGFPARCPSQHV